MLPLCATFHPYKQTAVAVYSQTLVKLATYRLRTSGPLSEIEYTPDSLITVLARSDFPVPDGPYSRTPLGGVRPGKTCKILSQ